MLEKSPEQECISDMMSFIVIYAERYKTDFSLTEFHPVHAEIIDRACRLTGRDPISPLFRSSGDRDVEAERKARGESSP